jgi:hemerythrin-like metal-binding protein
MTAVDTQTPLVWTDRYLLGHAPMDAEHADFVACVQALQQADDAALPAALAAFEAHARRHFGAEDLWMTETDFPARQCHIDEHAAVLRSVVEVREVVARGRPAEARRLTAELVRWFPGHADCLDSALSAWLCKRELGGQPVVLRRDILGN